MFQKEKILENTKTSFRSWNYPFQFREKGPTSLDGVEKEHLAIDLLKLCHDYQVPFIVNDDVDLAEKINADGIHVGQDDENVKSFAERFKDKIIGLSIGNEKEYYHSDLEHVDYIGVGPMFATISKMMLTHQ